jgi:hypothetical protein
MLSEQSALPAEIGKDTRIAQIRHPMLNQAQALCTQPLAPGSHALPGGFRLLSL